MKKPEASPTPQLPETPKPKEPDVALVHGVTEDGGGLAILRQREGRLEAGALRPLKEGVPIAGEVVKLRPRPEFPLLCDVDVEVAAPKTSDVKSPARLEAPRKGPAQVASETYRDNWDTIFGARRAKTELVN